MVKPMMRQSFATTQVIRYLLSLAAFVAPWVLAETLPDPTRPPAALYASPESPSSMTQSGPVLQSVFIASGRRVAIISGQAYKVGDRLGEARVVFFVVLVVVLLFWFFFLLLFFFPGIEKHSSANRAASLFVLWCFF